MASRAGERHEKRVRIIKKKGQSEKRQGEKRKAMKKGTLNLHNMYIEEKHFLRSTTDPIEVICLDNSDTRMPESLFADHLETLMVDNQKTLVALEVNRVSHKIIYGFALAFSRPRVWNESRLRALYFANGWGNSHVADSSLFAVLGSLSNYKHVRELQFGLLPFPLTEKLATAIVDGGLQITNLVVGTDKLETLVPALGHLHSLSLGVTARLTEKDAAAFGDYLEHTTTLKALDLRNLFGGEAPEVVLECLSRNVSLKSLEIVVGTTWDSLFFLLLSHPTLKHLRLGRFSNECFLSPQNACQLAYAIAEKNLIRSLSLGMEMGAELLEEFVRCQSLEEFRFYSDKKNMDDREVLTKAMHLFPNFGLLELRNCRLRDQQEWDQLLLVDMQENVERVVLVMDHFADRRIIRRNNFLRRLFSIFFCRKWVRQTFQGLLEQLPLYVVLRVLQFWLALAAVDIEQKEVFGGQDYWHSVEWFADYLDTRKRVKMVGWLQEIQ